MPLVCQIRHVEGSYDNESQLGNMEGETLGYIVEEEGSMASALSRQLLRTHRPFKALILDQQGATILWVTPSIFLILIAEYLYHVSYGGPLLLSIRDCLFRN